MKLTIKKQEEKLRAVVIFFSMFVALMLFQTSYMRLGTITASATLLLTIAAYFLLGGKLQTRLKANGSMILLAVFLLYSVFLTLFSGYTPNSFVRYISQVILCLVLFSVTLNAREHNYLKRVFTVAATVYAVLIIRSLTENAMEGYIHTHVKIFNTEFDPNFVGIPLTAAMAFLLDNALRKKHTFVSLVMYAILAVAVIYTASRGSFVAMLVSNMLVLILFVFKSKLRTLQKVLYLILPIVAIILLLRVLKLWFPVEWERVSNISADNDSGRLVLWKTAIEDWKQSPLFGNGIGYAYRAHAKATHNTYLQILSETGLVGTVLVGLFLLLMLHRAYRLDKVLFCALVGVMTQIMFLDALDNRCLWILLCWIVMLPDRKNWVVSNEETDSKNNSKLQEEKSQSLR